MIFAPLMGQAAAQTALKVVTSPITWCVLALAIVSGVSWFKVRDARIETRTVAAERDNLREKWNDAEKRYGTVVAVNQENKRQADASSERVKELQRGFDALSSDLAEQRKKSDAKIAELLKGTETYTCEQSIRYLIESVKKP